MTCFQLSGLTRKNLPMTEIVFFLTAAVSESSAQDLPMTEIVFFLTAAVSESSAQDVELSRL